MTGTTVGFEGGGFEFCIHAYINTYDQKIEGGIAQPTLH